MNEIIYRPIGVIHTPFSEAKDMPIQPAGAQGTDGWIELFPEFALGLKDVDGFSHLVLLYHFHMSEGYSLEVVPFMDDTLRGVFATRAPKRPNPIGLSVVRLVKIQENRLYVKDLDIVDGTPLLDIKPFVAEIDNRETTASGWLSEKAMKFRTKRSDDRFD
ncbi:MAG: tRNA (N6-threonylcarbamoyladenosine(37)-N6)-methyltransferase TrmO [Desulfomonilaceae bacterium]|nr:tRNA (N6-threonylcarbamoyladenosine(37)-N6)-methyltransferase TrmO [Desulfomonilaceae bacterium]